MEAPGPLRGAQPLVDLQKLLADVFDNILADFLQVSQPDAVGQPDRDSPERRKHRLLQHLHGTRQQLLRALVLLNWKPWKVLTELVDHERVMDIAASHVRTMTEVVGQMRQQAAGRIMAGSYLNMYDVNTALEVLTTGTYQELPSIILHRPPLFQPPPASLSRQRSRLAHVTQLIRARLVQVALPPGLKVASISNGTAILRAEGLYEAKLTLVPSEPLPGMDDDSAAGTTAAAEAGAGPGPSRPAGAEGDTAASGGWAAAAAAAAAADPVAVAAAAQRWKWRLIHFVLLIGVPFYDPRQPGQILNTCNFHMVLAADNAMYLRRQRNQQQVAAGAAGQRGQPGAAAPTESAATPAASGMPAPSGTAGAATAGGGGGGSLAAAVKRSEDDEVGAPLAVMHAILTDVAGRLLADELAAAARALAAPGSRWYGHIAVKPSQLLHPGVRIEYWINSPPLLSQRALPVPAPGEDYRAVKPGPPYLELGMGDGGCVEVLHGPSILHKPIAVSKLRLDTFRVNLEEVLMRAANMSSMFQLLLIRSELKANLVEAMGKRAPTTRLTTLARQLWCREGYPAQQQGQGQQATWGLLAGEEEGGTAAGTAGAAAAPPVAVPAAAASGAASGAAAAAGAAAATPMDVDVPADTAAAAAAAPPQPIPAPSAPPPEVSGLLARAGTAEEAAGALVVLNAPVLEYLVSGTTELKIGKHLFSGRLTLRPGQDERDEGSLDHAATIAMNEDYVNQAALSAYNSAAADAYPAGRALKEACAALCHVLQRTHTSTDATHFIQAARRAALHISRLPRGMLEGFTAASPGLAIEPRPREKAATWALQCVPFPPNFPPLEPVGPDTPPLRVPQCLSFFLQSRLSLASPHVLVVCTCTRQLMPIKVLSCIPVPPSTYRLPEHVMAAYMAAASSHHNHHHGNHYHSSGGGNHSLPHSGANSPRAVINGVEVAGRSPETSPLRESVAAGIYMGSGMFPPGRMSVGGVGAVATATAVPASGSDVGPPAGAASGIPSFPSTAASSPPQSQSKALPGQSGTTGIITTGQQLAAAGGRGPSTAGTAPNPRLPHGGTQTSGAGAHGRNQHGSGGGPSGRPTGQQVAVMLAQQQLSSVVRWCRRRMVWEVLLVQLAAVGATFQELSCPPCQRVRVTRVAGTALPCPIARRRGLVPPRVGPTCLELELGPDALAGKVTARLYGRFLCSPSCAPPRDDGSAGVGTSGGAAGFVQEPVGRSGGVGDGWGRSGSGGGGVVCLRRRYCLERGESALTLVQEVCAVIRTQTLLARLEMTALPAPAASAAIGATGTRGPPCHMPSHAQRLAVLAPLAPIVPSSSSLSLTSVDGSRPDLFTDGGRPAAAFTHSLDQSQPQQPFSPRVSAFQTADVKPLLGAMGGGHDSAGHHPAKRIKTEPSSGPQGKGDLACVNGGLDAWLSQGAVAGGNGSLGANGPVGRIGRPSANGGLGGGGRGAGHRGLNGYPPEGTAGQGPAASVDGRDLSTTDLAAAPPRPPPGLTWHWPLVGALTLEEYSVSAATLRVSPCTTQTFAGSPSLAAAAAAGPDSAPPPLPLHLHMTWAPRDVRHLHGAAAMAPPPPPAPSSPSLTPFVTSPVVPPLAAASPQLPGIATPSPYSTAPTHGGAPGGAAPSGTAPTPSASGVMLPAEAVVTTTRTVVGPRGGDPFGSQFSDLVLCTVTCSSGHVLPPEYLHVLEELAEAGEEGKLLDAVAVAAWPLAGFCAALRPSALARYGLGPDSDVRLTLHQPPYCHRIVCRRRSVPGHLLIDLVCQAVGRSYLKLSLPSLLPGQQQQQQQPQAQLDAAGAVKTEPGGATTGGGGDAPGGILQAVQQLAVAKLGPRVTVSVGGRAAPYGGLGPRPPAVPGPGSPLWLLVPNEAVQQAVELALSVL